MEKKHHQRSTGCSKASFSITNRKNNLHPNTQNLLSLFSFELHYFHRRHRCSSPRKIPGLKISESDEPRRFTGIMVAFETVIHGFVQKIDIIGAQKTLKSALEILLCPVPRNLQSLLSGKISNACEKISNAKNPVHPVVVK